MTNPENKPDMLQTGAALTTAGCSLMTMLPLLALLAAIAWCTISLMFR